jgi:hypothetical protein
MIFLSQKKKRLIHLFEKKMDDALTKILGPTIHASGPVMDHKRGSLVVLSMWPCKIISHPKF